MAAVDRKILNVQQFEGHISIKSGQNCKQQVMIMNHPKRLFFLIEIRITLVVSEFPSWWKVLANMLGLMTFDDSGIVYLMMNLLVLQIAVNGWDNFKHPWWQPLVSHKHWSLVYKSPQLASMESLLLQVKGGHSSISDITCTWYIVWYITANWIRVHVITTYPNQKSTFR